ncbi:SusC/RagA family TonB-linked outer membrane protein [Halpernia frigidisoli]|uniref:TonB-linked outer membrane protein, SusC/RagA family n=1 Tax=Halpernia frigidisoli TaxID=1125876 RepID=A0A1I3HW39_9FLAO|nr:SusC/RagA family TonB-linked outer membrane protein [Halpernia frigidisoli]SFI39833.1 TonB-linked outer membrane protein, SusC/RagA family [Halpernia frigidisoli]
MTKNQLIIPILFFISSVPVLGQQKITADSTSTSNIDEVIITSLGLKGERDKFASSASTVKGSGIAQSGETSVLTGLSAKASGVLITRNGGDPGAGAYIQIRGQNTIGGNAQPLFIIDGMPVSNSSSKIGASLANGIVQQSRINDINPEDIERVEVLKGASAAALWGSRAANGVIIITTKNGKNSNGKINISLKSTVSFDVVNKMHPLQTRYGQGSDGLYQQGNRLSFGDLISDRPGGVDNFITNPNTPGYMGFVTFPDGTVRYAIAPGTAANKNGGKNSRDTFNHGKDAFQTGHFIENNLTLNGGNENSNFLLSFSNLNQEGVIKSFSDYDRQTIRLNVGQKFNQYIKASANVNYIKSASSRVQEGDNVDGLLLSSLRTPGDFDNSLFEGTYTNAAGSIFPKAHVSYRNPLGIDRNTTYANPFWNIENNKNTSNIDRILGTVQLDITPLKWLSLTGRAGVDNFTDKRVERFASNSANFTDGYLSITSIQEKQFNTDLFALAKKEINENFKGSFLAGFNYNSRRSESVFNAITKLIIPNAPDILDNALNTNLRANNSSSLIRTYAFYGQLDFEAYNQVFITLTGRNESASTFGSKTSRNFFFPSAAVAWQFSDLNLFNEKKTFSFGKLRFTWGQVGIQPQPYQNLTLLNSANYGDPFTNGLSGVSSLYNGGYVRNTTQGNDFLKPEIKTEYELGVDLRFFRNRVCFSATAYSNRTKDVILGLSVPAETGFTIKNTNAAVLKNRGLELDLSGDVLRIGNFKWNLSTNFSTNKNTVVSLSGVKAYVLPDSFIQNASLIPGQPFGVFLSTDFLKDSLGNYILDANGFPQPGTGTEVIGDPNPDWRAGIGSTFSYKDFSLYVLFDRVQGNDVFNGTRGSLYAFGTHGDQGNTIIVPTGGLRDVNGNLLAAGSTYQGEIRDFGAGPVALNQAWYRGRGTASTTASYKQFVEDGSASRLREMTLTYSLRTEKLKKKLKLSSIDFSLTGRNLFLWTKYSGIDPESNVSGSGLARGQDWFTNPNTRSYLASILINY